MNFELTDINSINRTSAMVKTDHIVPDPDPLPIPHAWMIVVRPVPVRKISAGGIILSEDTIKDTQNLTTVGKVLKMGADAFKVGKATQSYDVGDYVVWSRMRGERFIYKGVSLVLLADDDVLMCVPNPEDLDPEKLVE